MLVAEGLRFSVGLVLLAAAVGKCRSIDKFTPTLKALQIPGQAARTVAGFLIAVEFLLGLPLIMGVMTRATTAAAITLFLGFMAVSVVGAASSNTVDYYCFGSGRSILGWPTFVRASVLCGAVLLAAVISTQTSGPWFEARLASCAVGAAVVAIAVMAQAGNNLKAVRRARLTLSARANTDASA